MISHGNMNGNVRLFFTRPILLNRCYSFRRKRFKWPEMTPSSRLSVASSSTIPIPIAVPTRASSRRLSTGSGTDSAISRPLRSGTMRPRSNPEYGVHARPSSKLSYDREDLTFVRILRVYEAYKPG